ncbi:hypothetical protein [Agriterribacter sp.]|uniref:hypothetical protein n=1 Tax=Agriterribacter sp. TaxID=2821509 RepID=UPI002C2F3C59|nr:hypothetical protein [Agriterribacter sp.]HRO45949.1 hypothetical protein [Agriterribacter sp.]HRQ19401.1 hypothetical protein [Agriterribacter sp.]
MKGEINVHRSIIYSKQWDNKRLVEIATELGTEVMFKKEYHRNVLGYFYGTIVAETEKEIFYFPMTTELTYGILPDSDLENCIGRSFSWPILKANSLEPEGYNSGFFISGDQEEMIPFEALEQPEIKEFSDEKMRDLNEITMSDAFESKKIKEIRIVDNQFLFSNPSWNNPFMIINNCSVRLSYSVSSMTLCQIIRDFDLLTFYYFKDISSSNWYFRLGLPRMPEFSVSRPAFQ